MKYTHFWACLVCLLATTRLLAQPSNDACANAIALQSGTNLCSPVAAYTNVNATPSGFGAATCWGSASNDVWFTFTAIATDITITINGNQAPSAGGTLLTPEAALYTGDCSGTINQLGCATASAGSNIVDLYKGGLIIGQTYLIRVQGRNGQTGTFQICLNNYNSPAPPGSDCVSASILCDKSPFTVQSITGAGANNDEAAGSCLGGLGTSSESNSTWFKWTCDQSGTLEFTLSPNNASDDLDFVVYELPNGINSCVGKTEQRCMAAGDTRFPSRCMGVTGLRASSTDVTETSGCDDPAKDNFVSALNMVSGRSYALLINNFSATGNGFSITFGGTGTFQGPRANFTATPATLCAGETISLQESSSFAFGTITNYFWTFGVSATPATSTSRTPSAVQYLSAGTKSISLTVQTDKGCVVTRVANVQVDSCCQTVNAINHTTSHQNVVCPLGNTGTATASQVGTSRFAYSFAWSNGRTTSQITGLTAGDYIVTVSNTICRIVDTVSIAQPPAWEIAASITRPTCAGGQNGAIALTTVQGANGLPYRYNWNSSGFGTNARLNNLPNGTYTLTVRDNRNCDTTLSYDVRELVLELDSVNMTLQNPSCFGYSDGIINALVANGRPPFSYQWANGATTSQLTNLPQGVYTLTQIRDANLCVGGSFTFTLTQPSQLLARADSMPVRCYGERNGAVAAIGTGGTQPYSYQWSIHNQDSSIAGLPAGRYYVNIIDANGCLASDTTYILTPPALYIDDIIRRAPTCYGDTNGTLQILASGGRGAYQYAISPDSIFGNNALFSNLAAGSYTLFVRDSAGCMVQRGAGLQAPRQLVVDAGANRVVELGDSFQVIANLGYVDFYSYTWSSPTSSQIACPTCRQTGIFPYDDGFYYVQISDADGCTALDSMFVRIERNYSVFVPNAFTPNMDGVNDIFRVFGNKTVRQVRSLRVFDRWGELVYSQGNYPIYFDNVGWDGTFKGREMPQDVYAYLLEVEFLDGKTQWYKGDVTLIRTAVYR